jgi:tetratricopeptide (TPR) repeat protein
LRDTGPKLALLVFYVALIVAAGLFAYQNAFANGSTNFDDQWQVVANPYVVSPGLDSVRNVVARPYHGVYLPVKLLSYMADYALWGGLGVDPIRGVHATNVALHIANSLLVALISFFALADLASERIDRRSAAFAGFFAGVLFAVHPIHVESVAWLSSRKDVLSFFFMALAFLAFRAACVKRWSIGYGLLALVLFPLALGSKSTVACFPLLAGLYWLLLSRRGGWLCGAVIAGLVIEAALAVLVASACVAEAGYGSAPIGGSYLTHVLTSIKTFPFYMRKLLFPTNLSVVYVLPAATGLLDPGVWWGLLMISAQVAVAVFVRAKTARFIVLWYLFALVPVLRFVPVAVPALAADRYAYIASVPFALAPALIALRIRTALLERRAIGVSTALVAACVVYAGALCVGAYSRNRVWRSSETLWRDCLSKNPTSRIALINLGDVYFRKGDYPSARELFERVIKLDPYNILAYYRVAQVFEKTGAPYMARTTYSRALAQPSSMTDRFTRRYRALAALHLAEMNLADHKHVAARTYATRSIAILGDLPDAREERPSMPAEEDVLLKAAAVYNRATDLIEKTRELSRGLVAKGDAAAEGGDPQAAERFYKRAGEVADEYYLPRVQLARLYLKYAEYEAAHEEFSAAFVRGAQGADLEHDFGTASLGSQRSDQAVLHLEAALELDPSLVEAKIKLALAHAFLGHRERAVEAIDEVLAAHPNNREALKVREMIRAAGAGTSGRVDRR